jgi:hypothetical protein
MRAQPTELLGIALTVLTCRQQRKGTLAIGRGDVDGSQRPPAEDLAQLEPCAGDQLRDRVGVQLHDLGDLLIGERLELT